MKKACPGWGRQAERGVCSPRARGLRGRGGELEDLYFSEGANFHSSMPCFIGQPSDLPVYRSPLVESRHRFLGDPTKVTTISTVDRSSPSLYA